MAKTNQVLTQAIQKLEEAGRKNNAPVYTRASEELQRSTRNQVEVNLSRINRYAEDGDTILVPGKVLGAGRLDKNITVAALEFTSSARKAINDAGELVYVEDLVDDNPSGDKVKLFK